MITIISLVIIDSSDFSFSRPVSFKIQNDKIYILEIIGNLWVLDSLKAEPTLLVKGLNQPSYDIEFIKDSIFIGHEGIISKFYKRKLENIITNLPRHTINSTIKLTADTSNSLYIAVSDKVFKMKANKLFLVASGFFEPIKLKRDKNNRIWMLAKINENVSGLFPIYENISYLDIEPIIKFIDEPSSFVIQDNKILVSFRNGKIIEYTKFRELLKGKVIFESDFEIVDFEFYKNNYYILDFQKGKIYKLK
ncbi:MAG: hypothetical protein ABIL49_02045 [candidate division WOR-3 bacterium]|jgi:hypothetical protein